MAPPTKSKPVRKDMFPALLKALPKPTLYSETARPTALPPNYRSLSWSPTGNLVATALGVNITIWDPQKPSFKQCTQLKGAGAATLERAVFSPRHESLLASTDGAGMCRLWDVRIPGGAAGGGKGSKLEECKTGDKGLFLTWHPNGQELLVGRADDVVQAVDIRRMSNFDNSATWSMQATERTPEKDKGHFNAMAFSNSGSCVFATTGEGPVKILDYPSMNVLHTLNAHTNETFAVQHSPSGNFVATGGTDSTICLWDTTHWHCANAIMTHSSAVQDLSFSFDGAYIIAASGREAGRDGGSSGIEISHADTGEHVHTVETKREASLVAWHPLRYWLAYAGDPGGIHIVGAGSTI